MSLAGKSTGTSKLEDTLGLLWVGRQVRKDRRERWINRGRLIGTPFGKDSGWGMKRLAGISRSLDTGKVAGTLGLTGTSGYYRRFDRHARVMSTLSKSLTGL
jgi:hypothetical protein